MTIECPKCQTDNPDSQKFCGECATPLPRIQDAIHTITLETFTEELTRGTVFADRYEIIEELGKGGMGRVYRVEDIKVKEEVALKLIKAEISTDKKTIERFTNELRTARKIGHRNVGRMYDIGDEKGSHYITMEYVSGQDLKGLIRQSKRLAIPTALAITREICEGLAEAHRLGIIHRDLKPSNIMIDKEGTARIMDFGIARTVKEKGITGSGVMIGTPEYMSPEQVEGRDVDQRSDIYSLGIILYEMTTGRTPFEGDSPFTIGVKHKSETPKDPKELNPQIPDDLSGVILKCLEKVKENRYQSAGALKSELEKIEQGMPTTDRVIPKKKTLTSKEITVQFSLRKALLPAVIAVVVVCVGLLIWQPWSKKDSLPEGPDKFSIAVLPFDDQSPEKDLGPFCGGLADDIITKLVKIKEWDIVDWNSVMQFQNTNKTPREISQELSATHLLAGKVRREGDHIHVTPRLINARDNRIIWQDTYVRKREEIFDIHGVIAWEMAGILNIDISPEEKTLLQKKATENIKAYELYKQGRWYWTKRTFGDLVRSIEFFTRAVEVDPNYALAHAGIADSYVLMGYYSFRSSPVDYFQKAEESALKALELDNTLAEAWTSLAYIKHNRDWDWASAEESFKKAIDLNPSYATAYHWYSILLGNQARLDEALEKVRRALELDPMSIVINSALANIYLGRREYDQALSVLKRTRELDPGYMNLNYFLGKAYLNKSLYEDALAAFDKFSEGVYEQMFSLELFEETLKYLLQNDDALRQFHTLLEATGRDPVSPTEFRREMEVWIGNQDALALAANEMKQLLAGNGEGFMHGVVYAKMGIVDKAKEILEQTVEISKLKFFQMDYQLAVLSFSLGNTDQGFSYLEKAVEYKDNLVRELKVDPLFDDVRSDPRFQSLLKKMGLN